MVNVFWMLVTFYLLNSLNYVRRCTLTLYSEQKDWQKQDRVIARFLCYSITEKSGKCTKSFEIMLTHKIQVICLWSHTDFRAYIFVRLLKCHQYLFEQLLSTYHVEYFDNIHIFIYICWMCCFPYLARSC